MRVTSSPRCSWARCLSHGARSSDLDIAKALSFQSSLGGRLGAILVRIGSVSEDVILAALVRAARPFAGHLRPTASRRIPTDYIVALEGLRYLPIDWWVDQSALVWIGADGVINCISRDPLVLPSLQETLSRRLRRQGAAVVADPQPRSRT